MLNNIYEIEIIVVDAISNDGSGDLVKKMFNNNNIIYLQNNKLYAPFAFNMGIKMARGSYIVIVGARSILSEDYLINCINSFKIDPKIACVGGIVNNTYSTENSRAIALAMASQMGVGFSNFRAKKQSGYSDTVGTPVFKKKIFDEIGIFDENLIRNQDDDLSYRIIKSGHSIWFSSEARVRYIVRNNLKNLSKQYFQYGYWKIFVNKKHRTITTLRQIAPALFLLFVLLGYPVLYISNLTLLYPIIILTYFILLLSSSVRANDSKKLIYTFKILLAIIIMHISYGYGYVKGFVDFLILNKNPSEESKVLTR